MVKEKSVTKVIRIPQKMWQRCEKLISKGEFATESELIRTALRDLLNKYEGEESGKRV